MLNKKHDNKITDFSSLPQIRLMELLDQYRHMPVKSRLDAMKKQYYLDVLKIASKKREKNV